MKRQSFIGIVTTLFFLCQLGNIDKVHALPSTCTDVETGCLKINEAALKDLKIKIDDITQQDTKIIVPSGTSLESSPTPAVNQEISFSIPDLWELKVPKGSDNGLEVEYTTIDNPNVAGSEMQIVKIEKLAITTRESISDSANSIIVTGGGKVTFNLSNIKASGNYLGNLQIKVTPGSPPP
jgi:hypothetical protein